MKKHGSAIAVAAKDWVDRYRDSRGAATAELLTFLLQVGLNLGVGWRAAHTAAQATAQLACILLLLVGSACWVQLG